MSADLPADLATVVRHELERAGVPGLTLGVLAEGEVVTAPFGVASVETGVGLRAESVFRIASITKPITATLAFLLAEEGLLALDEPVLAGEAISLRHLLSHRSGLDCELPGGLDGVASLAELDLSSVRRWAAPGELWAYSNAGFWLAGAAIGQALGQRFEDAFRERVLEPLGLERTTFELHEAILHAPAVGHEPVPDPSAREHAVVRSCYRYPPARRPSGGLISSVGDLLRLARAHLGDRFAAMREPLADAVGSSWALGWRLEPLGGATIVSHDGSYGGFNTRLLLVPERAFALAVLTNSARGSDAIEPVTDAALERYCGLQRKQPTRIDVGVEALRALAGGYRSDGLVVEVGVVGRGLELRGGSYDVSRDTWDPIPPASAHAVGPDTFAFDGTRELFDFPRDGLLRLSGRLAARS